MTTLLVFALIMRIYFYDLRRTVKEGNKIVVKCTIKCFNKYRIIYSSFKKYIFIQKKRKIPKKSTVIVCEYFCNLLVF